MKQTSSPSREKQAPTKPDYLKEINESHNIFYGGKEYLEGLPVRPTKRTEFVKKERYDDGAPSLCSSGDSFCKSPLAGSGKEHQIGFIAVFVSSALAVSISFAIIHQHYQLRKTRDASINNRLSAADDGCAPRKRKRRKKKRHISKNMECGDESVTLHLQSATAKDSCGVNADQDEAKCVGRVETSATLPTVNTSEAPDFEVTSNTVKPELLVEGIRVNIQQSQHLATFDDARAAKNEIITINNVSSDELYVSRFPSTEQLSSRWESKGLDRQKSLELAATFEMNIFFFEQLLHFLSTASLHFIRKMDVMHSQGQEQAEKHHRERMDAPEMEKLLRYRQQTGYILLKTPVVTRCLFLALASRFYVGVVDKSAPISSTIGVIINAAISTICHQCDGIPTVDTSQPSMTSYVFEFGRSAVYQSLQYVTQAWVCFARILCYTICISLCHRHLSRSISYAVIASVFIPWKGVLGSACLVLMVNTILTLWMSRSVERKENSVGVRESINHYSRIMPRYQAAAYTSALLIGLYLAV